MGARWTTPVEQLSRSPHTWRLPPRIPVVQSHTVLSKIPSLNPNDLTDPLAREGIMHPQALRAATEVSKDPTRLEEWRSEPALYHFLKVRRCAGQVAWRLCSDAWLPLLLTFAISHNPAVDAEVGASLTLGWRRTNGMA